MPDEKQEEIIKYLMYRPIFPPYNNPHPFCCVSSCLLCSLNKFSMLCPVNQNFPQFSDPHPFSFQILITCFSIRALKILWSQTTLAERGTWLSLVTVYFIFLCSRRYSKMQYKVLITVTIVSVILIYGGSADYVAKTWTKFGSVKPGYQDWHSYIKPVRTIQSSVRRQFV